MPFFAAINMGDSTTGISGTFGCSSLTPFFTIINLAVPCSSVSRVSGFPDFSALF
uniref:Uncharacterized protein n=1 Tax=Rhizophora mucronata TaxID=61149 RepID=A0A2P2QWM2_RHIMU